MVQLIMQIAKQERTTARLCNITTGRLESKSPLAIRMSQKILLTSEFLIVTESFSRLLPSLGVGDSIVMIRAEGGQRYLLIDREVKV